MQTQSFKAAVVVFPGSNGDRDLFETFAAAGFAPFYHPSNESLPSDVAVVGLPGGFSYGDYWRAGMLASQARAMQDLPAHVARGGLVIGICNGFQILVEAGLLPGALTYNTPPGFRHAWVDIRVTSAATQSPWLSALKAGDVLHLPMAHGEGNYCAVPDSVPPTVPFEYIRNPNGSMFDAAALLDDSGRILGIMPHPERAADADLGSADGMALFRGAYQWCSRAAQGVAK